MAKNNKEKFHRNFISSFHFLEDSFSCKFMEKNFLDKCLLFCWLHWICFLLSNLMWLGAISLYLLSRVYQGDWLIFEKLKWNYLLKRKKQPVRVIPEISCILKEAATEVIPGKEMLLIFIIIEIVEKLKYTNGLQPVTSLKSGLRHRYLLFSFFVFFFFIYLF